MMMMMMMMMMVASDLFVSRIGQWHVRLAIVIITKFWLLNGV